MTDIVIKSSQLVAGCNTVDESHFDRTNVWFSLSLSPSLKLQTLSLSNFSKPGFDRKLIFHSFPHTTTNLKNTINMAQKRKVIDLFGNSYISLLMYG
jgi:hypothetical protein